MRVEKWLCLLLGVVLVFGVGFFLGEAFNFQKKSFLLPVAEKIVKTLSKKDRPLDKYTYENLKRRTANGSDFKIEKVLRSGDKFNVWEFSFKTEGKKVSGAANYPTEIATDSGKINAPIVVMVRGYQDEENYHIGAGTERVAGELAKNGFVTFAPDFLGFGDSASASADPFEARFETYTTVLDLIATLCQVSTRLPDYPSTSLRASQTTALKVSVDSRPVDCRLGLWGHSNGGQITLSVLEISGKIIPTVLWNPVSKYFPYSILYFSDNDDDRGRKLRKVLADFEEKYDSEKYALDNYLDWIKAPILLQQGSADESVPQKWSDDLSEALKKKDKAIEYKVYLGADHNMLPKWNEAVSEASNFYKLFLLESEQ